MKNILDTLNLRELGKELQLARNKKGLTQEEAAAVIEVARTTLTAIEQGKRRLKPSELIKLARAYNCQVHDLVRSRPQIEPFQVQFRGSQQPSEADKQLIQGSIDLLAEVSRNYLELEQLIGVGQIQNYPPSYKMSGLSYKEAAEHIAQKERYRLGLGDGPIYNLRNILEQDVGLRIFYLEMQPSQHFSGMYHFDEQLGGCIAINCLHPVERRNYSLTHEYWHFLVDRYAPSVSYYNYQERLADSFASYFLMPTDGLKRHYNDLKQAQGKITPIDLLTMANYYGVSFEAFLNRLLDLALISPSIKDKLIRGISIRQTQQDMGLNLERERPEKFPVRYLYLAVQAWDRHLITEGQLAHYLQLSRVEAREVVEKIHEEYAIEWFDLLENIMA